MELQSIVQEIHSLKSDINEGVPLMLVGNKSDESDQREVVAADGQAMAKQWSCGFIETSAKDNVNVKETFQELLQVNKIVVSLIMYTISTFLYF